jgi:hypothetical protein
VRIAASLPREASRRDLAIAVAMAAVAVAAVMVDCILFQMATGGIELGLALRWMVGAVAPWTVAFTLLRTRVTAEGGRPSLEELALIGGAFAASVLLDAALIPPADLAELGGRMQGRLPLAGLVPLAARLRLDLGRCAEPRPAPIDRRFVEARVVTAAGNYVEVEGPAGRRILRMTLAEVERRLEPQHYLRIHRGTIVALALIDRLERDRNGIVGVRLADGRSLRVGPSCRARVRKALAG